MSQVRARLRDREIWPDEREGLRPGKDRALYIILGIFLGLLGVHNFYAQRVPAACMQLALGILGAALLPVALPVALSAIVLNLALVIHDLCTVK